MTAAVRTRSAYPAAVAELLPRARAMVVELGEVPSQRRLKTELRIGMEKARAVRAALVDDVEDQGVKPEAVPVKPAAVSVPTEPAAAPEPGTPEPPATPEPGTGEQVTSPVPAVAPVEPMPPVAVVAAPLAGVAVGPVPATDVTAVPLASKTGRRVSVWPVFLLALPAFVAIWSGWVGLGGLTGFGIVHPLPGIWDGLRLNTAITLPIGVETYAAYALRVWLTPGMGGRARRFAKWSAIGALLLGACGQAAYHLMAARHMDHAPALITTLVASLPVAVLGMGAALAHLSHNSGPDERTG